MAKTLTEGRHLFTMAQAKEFIKTAPRGTGFALSIRNDAPVNDEECFRMGLSGYLTITRAQALRLAGELLTPQLEAKGARFPVRVSVFNDYAGRRSETVWIGS